MRWDLSVAFSSLCLILLVVCFFVQTNLVVAILFCFLGFQEISQLSSYEVIIPQKLGRERRETSNASSTQVLGYQCPQFSIFFLTKSAQNQP